MLDRKGHTHIVLLLLCLIFTGTAQASDPYTTLYMGHLSDKTGIPFQHTYTYEANITHHAFTFDATTGEILTLSATWVTEPPPAGFGDPWQPDLIMTAGMPPVAPGQVFPWDLSAAIRDWTIHPQDRNKTGDTLEDWEVPATDTYILYIKFYPYQESSGGTYAVSIAGQNASPAEAGSSSDHAEGWMGEFPQLENGDYFTTGIISDNPSWNTHSFIAKPGDLLSIMAWSNQDSSADPLEPNLILCRNGCSTSTTDPLAQSLSDGSGGVAVINYQVPPAEPANTLYTVLVDGRTTTGPYSIWMRQWRPTSLADQVMGGWTGEFARNEAGELNMDGVFSTSTAFTVHSFLANPGDSASVTVRAKRDTPADRLIPVVLLVAGGYEPGEPWLAMAASGAETATLSATIPANMPPELLYTVVVADMSNIGQLLFGEAPITGQTGGYTASVTHVPLGRP